MIGRWVALLAILCGVTAAATAHEMSMAEMEMQQLSQTVFIWQWTASGARPANEVLTPIWPDGCTAEENIVRCGEGGMRGTLRMEGVGKMYSAVIMKVSWLDGQTRAYTMTGAQPTVQLFGSAEDHRAVG